MSENRIQKILAQAGIASRRKAEELIKSGAVTVNGKVAKLGDKATFGKDHIKLNGKLITKVESHIYVLFNKPKGVISMFEDPQGRQNLKAYFSKITYRLFPVGHLDFNSDGLLLLTNDGDLSESIQKNPKFPRIYTAKIKGYLTSEMLKRIERGGKVGGSYVKPYSVRICEELAKKTKIEIVLLGEANADLKAFLESRGFLVEKITRIGMGHLNLKGLEAGSYRFLEKSKLEALVTQPELGVQELEKRIDKSYEILPVDLKEDGGFKLAMTLAPKGAKKAAAHMRRGDAIRMLKEEVARATDVREEVDAENETPRAPAKAYGSTETRGGREHVRGTPSAPRGGGRSGEGRGPRGEPRGERSLRGDAPSDGRSGEGRFSKSAGERTERSERPVRPARSTTYERMPSAAPGARDRFGGKGGSSRRPKGFVGASYDSEKSSAAPAAPKKKGYLSRNTMGATPPSRRSEPGDTAADRPKYTPRTKPSRFSATRSGPKRGGKKSRD